MFQPNRRNLQALGTAPTFECLKEAGATWWVIVTAFCFCDFTHLWTLNAQPEGLRLFPPVGIHGRGAAAHRGPDTNWLVTYIEPTSTLSHRHLPASAAIKWKNKIHFPDVLTALWSKLCGYVMQGIELHGGNISSSQSSMVTRYTNSYLQHIIKVNNSFNLIFVELWSGC